MDNLFLKDDILYRKHSLNGTNVNQLVLPEIYHDIALHGLHDDASHQGRDRTMSLVKSRFYWPGMDGDIKKFVKNCPRCIRMKAQGRTSAKLVVVESTYHMDLVCLDFLSLKSSGLLEDMSTYWSSLTILPDMLRLSQPTISQPKPQPEPYLTISSVTMASQLAFTAIKVATLKARLLRSCVPLLVLIS